MQQLTILLGLATLLATGGAGSDAATKERLSFEPTLGTSLTKTLYISHELGLTAVNRTRDGGPPVTDGTTGWVSTWLKVSCEDAYLEVDAGLPRRFHRRFIDLGGGGKLDMKIGQKQMPHEELLVAVSPLRNRTVEFTWIPEENDWARSWTRFDAEEFWLADLNGDMELLALLPAGEVEVGESWSPPLDAARKMLAPGGNHLITPRTKNIFGRSVEVGIGGDASEVLGANPAGSVSARFEGVREVDGKRLGAISVRIEGLRSVEDRTDLWRTSMPIDEKREKAKLLAALIEYSVDAEGELLWDLEGGHMHSFQLTGKEGYNLVVSKEITGERTVFELSQHSVFSGDLALSITLGDPDAGPDGSTEAADGGR